MEMTSSARLILELTPKEAEVLMRLVQNTTPPQADEMIVLMLYSRLVKLVGAGV